MGSCIYLSISQSVTQREWEDVYDETLRLIEAFPLAELHTVLVREIETWCLIPTEDREECYGWRHTQKGVEYIMRRGWWVSGHYGYRDVGEGYCLFRDYIEKRDVVADAPDAMFERILELLYDNSHEYDHKYDNFTRPYRLWGNKTYGGTYQRYLIAIACLIQSRLGSKAYVYGFDNPGQCERAVCLANELLTVPIHVPDQYDLKRLYARISKMPLTEEEKFRAFDYSYCGEKDAAYGAFIREHFSAELLDQLCRELFEHDPINEYGFSRQLRTYLTWGFDLTKLCSFLTLTDSDGRDHHEDFIKALMDTKIYLPTKETIEVPDIDFDDYEPLKRSTLFAHLFLWGIRDRIVDRYIPIEEVRKTLADAIGDVCDTDTIIDEYLRNKAKQVRADLFKEPNEEDAKEDYDLDDPDFLRAVIELDRASRMRKRMAYNIIDEDELPFYRPGDTVHPDILNEMIAFFASYRSITGEGLFQELMAATPEERCLWLQRSNSYIYLRYSDWEKIYDDIMAHRASFERYYPMVRVDINLCRKSKMIQAFVTNDDLYAYATEMTRDRTDESASAAIPCQPLRTQPLEQ